MNEIMPLDGQALLAQGNVDADFLLDASSSISSRGLIEAVLATAASLETLPARVQGARISRSFFNSQHVQVDEGKFVSAVERPFGDFYRTGTGTYLDRFFNRHLRRLERRLSADSRRMQLLTVVTDGEDFGSPEDRQALVRERMTRIRELAEAAGGLDKARAVVWYIGVGLTPEHHFRIATDRYCIPREWVSVVPATRAAVSRVGETVTQMVESQTLIF